VTARCPCCMKLLVVGLAGRFPRHRRHGGGCGPNGCPCEGSGWLVEDEELVA
jgi:hypothetical protein